MIPLTLTLTLIAWIIPAQAQNAADAGRTLYGQQSAACHGDNGEGRVGPSLGAVVGRKAAPDRACDYSAALRRSGITWTPAQLARFIQAPQAVVKGTQMAYPDCRQRAPPA